MIAYRKSGEPLVFGHRGAAARELENTLVSIGAAINAGADGVEIDIRLTSDDIVVLLHDETLDRTGQGRGKIRETTWAEARRGAGEKQSVASLEETIDFIAGRCALNVEIKDPAAWPFAKEIVGRTGSSWTASSGGGSRKHETDIWFSSFDLGLMEQISGEGFDVGLLFSAHRRRWSNAEIVASAARIKPRALHLPADLFVPEIIERSPVPIYVWTINDPDEARSLVERGVAAIYSDDPALIIDNLKRRR